MTPYLLDGQRNILDGKERSGDAEIEEEKNEKNNIIVGKKGKKADDMKNKKDTEKEKTVEKVDKNNSNNTKDSSEKIDVMDYKKSTIWFIHEKQLKLYQKQSDTYIQACNISMTKIIIQSYKNLFLKWHLNLINHKSDRKAILISDRKRMKIVLPWMKNLVFLRKCWKAVRRYKLNFFVFFIFHLTYLTTTFRHLFVYLFIYFSYKSFFCPLSFLFFDAKSI